MRTIEDKAHKHVRELHDIPMTCPFCDKKLSFTESVPQDPKKNYEVHRVCSHCDAKIVKCVPILDTRPWYWRRDESIREYVERVGMDKLPKEMTSSDDSGLRRPMSPGWLKERRQNSNEEEDNG